MVLKGYRFGFVDRNGVERTIAARFKAYLETKLYMLTGKHDELVVVSYNERRAIIPTSCTT
jgi:hypothetical protein